MFRWLFKARTKSASGRGQEALPDVPGLDVASLTPEELRNLTWRLETISRHASLRRPDLEDWQEPTCCEREAEPDEHVQHVVNMLRGEGSTGYIPAYYIHSIYREACWIANIKPLQSRRHVEWALAAQLRKSRKTTQGGRFLTVYYIPKHDEPCAEHVEDREQHVAQHVESPNVVAFASKKSRRKKRVTAKSRRKGGGRAKSYLAAA